MSRSKVRGELFRVHRTNGSITAYGQYSVKKVPQFSYIKMKDLGKVFMLAIQSPKKKLIFVLFAFLVHNSTYYNVIP